MKKLNNKGMTLVELIVSFAIVTVAVVYFSQSLITTSKLFKNTKEETDAYVEEVYVYRLLEAMFEEYSKSSEKDKIGSKQIGIVGNKYAGKDTIFIYCDVKDNDPSNIKSIFDVDAIIDLNIKYGFGNMYTVENHWEIQRPYSSTLTGYIRNVKNNVLKKLNISEYARTFSSDNKTLLWNYVNGKSCSQISSSTTEGKFENGNFWIPIEYYDAFNVDKARDPNLWNLWDASGKDWIIYKKNNGDKLKFDSLNNYYNPALKLFVSIAKIGDNTYKYYRSFNYSDYISSGSNEFKYFLTYQLGNYDIKKSKLELSGVKTTEKNTSYHATVRVKTFCTAGTDASIQNSFCPDDMLDELDNFNE